MAKTKLKRMDRFELLELLYNMRKANVDLTERLEAAEQKIQALEKELLAQNAGHKDWCCTEDLMALTKDKKALYLHCLPADINGVSCEEGEVEASVFDRYRDSLYRQASYKPYIIAAMIFLAKQKDPAATLEALTRRNAPRHMK